MGEVKVFANEDGVLVVPNPNKPEYGSILAKQSTISFTGGFLNERTKSTFIAGELKKLENWVKTANLKDGSIIPGTIVVKEQLGEQHYEGQQEKIDPTTGEYLLKDGEYIYRDTYYTDNPGVDDIDELVKADEERGEIANWWEAQEEEVEEAPKAKKQKPVKPGRK